MCRSYCGDCGGQCAETQAARVDVAHWLGQAPSLRPRKTRVLAWRLCQEGAISKGQDAGKTGHQVWLGKYRALLARSRKEPFVIHHAQGHDGALPVWVS